MTAAPTTVVVRRRLTADQQERRDRVLEVAQELAREGGYDAVVMRDVAERSGVALGTLYRYFASKDHLLAEVLVGWGGDLDIRLAGAPPPGATPLERVVDVLRRAGARSSVTRCSRLRSRRRSSHPIPAWPRRAPPSTG